MQVAWEIRHVGSIEGDEIMKMIGGEVGVISCFAKFASRGCTRRRGGVSVYGDFGSFGFVRGRGAAAGAG